MTHERKTEETLRKCAKWLDEHAEELARGFCRDMGCEEWTVRFHANCCGGIMSGVVMVEIEDQKVAYIDYARSE